MGRPSWQQGVGQAVLAAVLTIAVVGLLEGALRLADVPDRGLYEGDRAWVWWLRSGLDRDVTDPATSRVFSVKTGPLGVRGTPPPDTGPWTLALGCSTTFGWGVSAEAAWPSVLSSSLGEPVVNAGVPGWSTVQAVRGAERFLALEPSRVVLAFGVRDAWPSPRADLDARPTPWLLNTQLARLLRPAPAASTARQPDPDWPWRVPPDVVADNLVALAEAARAHGAEPVLVLFPQPEPWPPAALAEAFESAAERSGAVVVVPRLPRGAFFDDDPVHLTEAGHAQLASILGPVVSGGVHITE